MITAEQVKNLRAKTGVGILDVREALNATNGDETLAIEYLRKKGLGQREKRADKQASEGLLYSYIHAGSKVGTFLEVGCETDFSSRSIEFGEFVKNLALHIVAMKPRYVNVSDVPIEEIEKEKEIIKAQMDVGKKPAHIIEKIIEGRLEKFYGDIVLMKQQFVKNPDIIIEDLLVNLSSKIKENIVVKRFVLWHLGE